MSEYSMGNMNEKFASTPNPEVYSDEGDWLALHGILTAVAIHQKFGQRVTNPDDEQYAVDFYDS